MSRKIIIYYILQYIFCVVYSFWIDKEKELNEDIYKYIAVKLKKNKINIELWNWTTNKIVEALELLCGMFTVEHKMILSQKHFEDFTKIWNACFTKNNGEIYQHLTDEIKRKTYYLQ